MLCANLYLVTARRSNTSRIDKRNYYANITQTKIRTLDSRGASLMVKTTLRTNPWIFSSHSVVKCTKSRLLKYS